MARHIAIRERWRLTCRAQLVRREAPPHARLGGKPTALDPNAGALPRPASRWAMMRNSDPTGSSMRARHKIAIAATVWLPDAGLRYLEAVERRSTSYARNRLPQLCAASSVSGAARWRLPPQHLETSPMPDPQPVMARQHATTNVLSAQVEQTVGEIRDQLTSRRFDYAGDIAVLAAARSPACCRSSAC